MRCLKVALVLFLSAASSKVVADNWIAFLSKREGNRNCRFIIQPDGSNLINLSESLGVRPTESQSPDKTKIVFDSGGGSDSDIYVMDIDGSNRVKLSHNTISNNSPRWSPDGTQVLWYGWWPPIRGEGAPRIYLNDADGANLRDLGRGLWPHWSPDGTMIGFTLYGRQDNAFVMNADGSGRRQVTDKLFPTRFISWSRDGTKVAFDHRKPFGFVQNKIYIANVDGTGLFELTKDVPEVDCYGAAWSPDGTKIAITSTGGIYVLNSDGTNPINITIHHDNRWGSSPRWSPDGSKILYQITVWIGDVHHGEIYIMNADGSSPFNLSNHPAEDYGGYWYNGLLPSATSVAQQEKLISIWGEIKAVGSSQ